jgi:hypothetical protein
MIFKNKKSINTGPISKLSHFAIMSRVVRKNHGYLQLLVSCPHHQRQFLLVAATPEQVHAIFQAAHNVRQGHVPLSNREVSQLTPHKDSIEDLQNPNISYKEKKQILVQEGGSFIPDLLIPFLTGLLI